MYCFEGWKDSMVVDLWFQENFQENVKKKKPRRNSNLFLLFLLHLRVPTFTFHLPMRRLQLFLFHTFAGSPDKHSSSSNGWSLDCCMVLLLFFFNRRRRFEVVVMISTSRYAVKIKKRFLQIKRFLQTKKELNKSLVIKYPKSEINGL